MATKSRRGVLDRVMPQSLLPYDYRCHYIMRDSVNVQFECLGNNHGGIECLLLLEVVRFFAGFRLPTIRQVIPPNSRN
jgi:hypothetical protein